MEETSTLQSNLGEIHNLFYAGRGNQKPSPKPKIPIEAGFTTALKKMVHGSPKSDVLDLSSPEELALQRQWIELRMCTRVSAQNLSSIMSLLNRALKNQTFLVSNRATLADILWLISLSDLLMGLTYSEKERWCHVTRWAAQVNHRLCVPKMKSFYKSKTSLY